jgi:hypothetical protein
MTLLLSPSGTLLGMLDLVLSLPSSGQLEAGDFILDDLVNKLTGALVNESHRNEILSLTGDTAVLVIECLDRASESESASCIPSPYCTLDCRF